METHQVKFCQHCGRKLEKVQKFCPGCGQRLAEDNAQQQVPQQEALQQPAPKADNLLTQLAPNESRIAGLKSFIINNFEIVHLGYFLVFLMGLASAKWGFILLIVLIGAMYLRSTLVGDDQVVAFNQQADTAPVEAVVQKTVAGQSSAAVVSDPVPAQTPPAESVTETTNPQPVAEKVTIQREPEPTIVHNQEPVRTSANNWGVTEALVIVTVILSLMGVLMGGFIKISNSSLFDLLSQASQVAGYADTARAFLGDSSSNSAGAIQGVSYALIGIPIISLIMTFINTKVAHLIGFVAALAEVAFFGYCVSRVMDTADQMGVTGQFAGQVADAASHQVGFPFYALLVGSVGLVIITFIKLLKPRQ